MAKWKLLLIAMLMLPLAVAYTNVDISADNTTWEHLITTNNNSVIVEGTYEQWGINESETYYIRLQHIYETGVSNYTYATVETGESGGFAMNDLAIMFVLSAFGVLFIIIGYILFNRREN